MIRAALLLLTLALPSGCGAGLLSDPPAAVARVADTRIREASGIAASRRHPGLYYIHNDSGDRAQVFLIDRDGNTRAVVLLRGAAAVDYEDIAIAPGGAPNTWDVVVADIGDNDARRPNVTLYRFPEPDLPPAGTATIEVTPTASTFHYADGPRNAEALCIHPRTGVAYIVTKQFEGAPEIYRVPFAGKGVAARVGELPLPALLQPLRVVTAADISPDGRRLAVRCMVQGWELQLPGDASDADFERVFTVRPVPLDLPPERQGEAIAYSADGEALLTVSEGANATLYELRVEPAPAAASRPTTAPPGP